MTRTALAFSPHLDDAAFSCGGTLAELAVKGWRVVVATVFTATVPDPRGFALACQLDKGLGAEVDYMALRRAEDAMAMQELGAVPAWLPFREAPHRGYESAPALFGGVQEADQIDGVLGEAFSALIAQHRPDLLLAPQAVGGHVDHIQVVRGLKQALDADALPVLWWTDYPYSIRRDTPSRPFAQELEALPALDFALGEASLTAKQEAVLAYQSQIGFQFGGAEALAQRLAEAGRTESFRGSGALPPLP